MEANLKIKVFIERLSLNGNTKNFFLDPNLCEDTPFNLKSFLSNDQQVYSSSRTAAATNDAPHNRSLKVERLLNTSKFSIDQEINNDTSNDIKNKNIKSKNKEIPLNKRNSKIRISTKITPCCIVNHNDSNVSIESEDRNGSSLYIPNPQKTICYSPLGMTQDFRGCPRVRLRCSMNCAPFSGHQDIPQANYMQNNRINRNSNMNRMSSQNSIDEKSNSSLSQSIPHRIPRMSMTNKDICNMQESFLINNMNQGFDFDCCSSETNMLRAELARLQNENSRVVEDNKALQDLVNRITYEK